MSDFPYPGLRPFYKDEVDIFFGREEQVDQLLEKLEQSRFLAVVGPSGSGKSSLVITGLLNALETGFLASSGVNWRIINLRPGTHPLDDLAKLLVEQDEEMSKKNEMPHEVQQAFLLATLRRGPLGLVEALRINPLPKGENLLILVDQFEEIFRYRQHYNVNEAEAFVSLLLSSSQQREFPIYIVMTMRSDFLGNCALFNGLPERLNESQFLTPRLTREQSRSAIENPAKVFGGIVEPALVNRLLNDMGSEPDQLPLLQHALMRLWGQAQERGQTTLTLEEYERIGGLGQALSNHADRVFEGLDATQKRIAETMFRALTERSAEKQDTRRPRPLAEIVAVAGVTPDQVITIVEAFRLPGRSFLTPPAGKTLGLESLIDISHESLIRQWHKLQEWVEEEADSAEQYRRLEQTAKEWKNGKAALWGTPDLEIALEWRKEQKPNLAWAKRYGGNFEWAMEFLDCSQSKQEEEKKAEEAARQAELKKKVKTYGTISLFLFAVLIAGAYQSYQYYNYYLKVQISEISLRGANKEYPQAYEALKKYSSKYSYIYKLSSLFPRQNHAIELIKWYLGALNVAEDKDKKFLSSGERLTDIELSPDGKILMAVGDNGLVVRNTENVALEKPLEGFSDKLYAVVIDPSSKWLAAAAGDNGIVFWNLPSGKRVDWTKEKEKIYSLAISPDGKTLVSGGDDGNVTLWNVATHEKLSPLMGDGHSDRISRLAFSPDGNLLASASKDGTVKLWEITSRKLTQTLKPNDLLPDSLSRFFNKNAPPDCNLNLNSKLLALRISKGSTGPKGLAFSPDSKKLVTVGSFDNTIHLWDVDSHSEQFGQIVAEFQGHKSGISDVGFLDSDHIISSSMDRTLRLWNTEDCSMERVFVGQSAFTGIAIHADHIYATSVDGTIPHWTVPKIANHKKQEFNLPDEARSVAIAPNGSTIAVGFRDGTLSLYKLPGKLPVPDIEHPIWQHKEHSESINSIDFSPDGQHLVTASDDHTVKLWNTGTGGLEKVFEGHEAEVRMATFAPDGLRLATASLDGKIGLCKTDEKKCRFFDSGENKNKVYSVAFDFTGKQLLSTGEHGSVNRWDVAQDANTLTPIEGWKPKTSSGDVYRGVFSPDGTSFASGGQDGILHVFNEDGEDQSFLGHELVLDAVFSPDGGQVATISINRKIRLWDIDSDTELFELESPNSLPFSQRPTEKDGKPHDEKDRKPRADFDFRCNDNSCWIAVPLRGKKLVLYDLGPIYKK